MSGFTDVLFEKKLLELSNSQQSIQTLSLWIIHYRKHHKTIVQVWFRELLKAKSSRKLTFMYLANDVIQNSKKKGPEFSKEFSTILSEAFAHVYKSVSDGKTRSGLERIINVWEERNIYDSLIMNEFRSSVNIESPILPVKKLEYKLESKSSGRKTKVVKTSGFTDVVLEKKLLELSNSQQSIQTLSLWIIHYRKHHKTIVSVWYRELKKAKSSRKLTFMYLANDVIQNSKKKGPEFSKEFSTILSEAFAHVYKSVSDEKTKSGLERIINVWRERNIYDSHFINELRSSMNIESPILPIKRSKSTSEKTERKSSERKINYIGPVSKKRKLINGEIDNFLSPVDDPSDAEVLMKTVQDLENCPPTNNVVREKNARLTPGVSVFTPLENIEIKMSGFTDVLFEKKLLELSNSQQSIQTLSLWIIHYRKHHKTIVQVWFRELKKAKSSRKLTFMYLANDVLQNSRKKGPEFSNEFSTILSKAFAHVYKSVSGNETKGGLDRIISVWKERNIYDSQFINELQSCMNIESPILPFKMLEYKSESKSCERKINVAREGAENLSKLVEEACTIFPAESNNRLSDELENRKQVLKMLNDYTCAQRELATTESEIEEIKEQLKCVSQVRYELNSHLQNLPDISLLPSIPSGLVPLSSAGDLFNQP